MLKENIKKRRKTLNLTLLEVAEAIGVTEATMQRYESGQIKNIPYDKIEQLAVALKCSPQQLMGWEDISDVVESLYPTPIFENVSAGFGAAAIDYIVDYIALPFNSKSEADETICIKVRGDSMSPKIMDGDLIQVHKQTSVDCGDIAVILLDGDNGFVKKVEYGEDFIKLISLNMGYEPIVLKGPAVQRCSVVGKVKRVIRDL